MLILKKSIKSFVLIIILGIVGGWLSHIIHPVFYDPILYPDEGIKLSLVMGLVITALTYYILLFLKTSSYYFEQSSTLKKGIYAVAITLVIFLVICLVTFGINLIGLILYLLSFSLPNFFIPYLDSGLTKMLNVTSIAK